VKKGEILRRLTQPYSDSARLTNATAFPSRRRTKMLVVLTNGLPPTHDFLNKESEAGLLIRFFCFLP
jgi:hypothetical protein